MWSLIAGLIATLIGRLRRTPPPQGETWDPDEWR